MFWISWWADYPDPENFLFPLFHSSNHGPSGNRTRYTNKTVDALIESGQKSLSRSEQYRAYEKAEKIINRRGAMGILLAQDRYYAEADCDKELQDISHLQY